MGFIIGGLPSLRILPFSQRLFLVGEEKCRVGGDDWPSLPAWPIAPLRAGQTTKSVVTKQSEKRVDVLSHSYSKFAGVPEMKLRRRVLNSVRLSRGSMVFASCWA